MPCSMRPIPAQESSHRWSHVVTTGTGPRNSGRAIPRVSPPGPDGEGPKSWGFIIGQRVSVDKRGGSPGRTTTSVSTRSRPPSRFRQPARTLLAEVEHASRRFLPRLDSCLYRVAAHPGHPGVGARVAADLAGLPGAPARAVRVTVTGGGAWTAHEGLAILGAQRPTVGEGDGERFESARERGGARTPGTCRPWDRGSSGS
jgi:hypothetical protein